MPDLRDQLREIFQGRVCLVGVGNVALGDDGLGGRLAENLMVRPRADFPASAGFGRSGFGFEVLNAGTTPERWLEQLAGGGFDHVVFVDAVEFGARAGAVVLLDAGQMASRFPQVSTHKISLGALARLLEASGTTRVWLMGVQPATLRAGEGLSEPVRRTLGLLRQLIAGACGGAESQAVKANDAQCVAAAVADES